MFHCSIQGKPFDTMRPKWMTCTADQTKASIEAVGAEPFARGQGGGFAAIKDGFDSIARMKHCRRFCNGGQAKLPRVAREKRSILVARWTFETCCAAHDDDALDFS